MPIAGEVAKREGSSIGVARAKRVGTGDPPLVVFICPRVTLLPDWTRARE